MKKFFLIVILLFICFNFIPSIVLAISGCCSYHGGVDCSRKQSDGRVVCNDGWTGSSCYYNSMVKCRGTSISNSNSNDDNDISSNTSSRSNSKSNYTLLLIALISGYAIYKISYFVAKDIVVAEEAAKKVVELEEEDYMEMPDKIMLITDAIELGVDIMIKYNSSNKEITTRRVKPIEIYVVNEEYYLKGFCFLRSKERVFKIRRIVEVKIKK